MMTSFIISYAHPECKEGFSVSNERKNETRWDAYTLTAIGVLAAAVYVVTLFRFPLLGSKVHFANAVCLLAGLLLGPVPGGLAAGLGSAIYDLMAGYGAETIITFVSKFAMAWVCGKVFLAFGQKRFQIDRLAVASACGAFTYVALYMLKSLIMYGWGGVVSRFPASIINAVVAIIAAPVFFTAVWPAVKHILHREHKKDQDQHAV